MLIDLQLLRNVCENETQFNSLKAFKRLYDSVFKDFAKTF